MATYPSLRGKVVLITGGAEGIGAATTRMFVHQASKVIILDISEPSATALINSIHEDEKATPSPSGFHPPEFYHCDVTSLPRLREVADSVLATHTAVDILINNAAAAGRQSRVPSIQVTPDIWDLDVNTNLRHIFFLTTYLVPAMQRQRSGSIINMGSITWRIPSTDTPVYATCKAAILGLTRTHAKEFGGDGVRVNSVMPGAIATERQRREVLTEAYREEVMRSQSLKRDLLPEDVARVVLFLGSEEASGVTGSSYVVDGGWCG